MGFQKVTYMMLISCFEVWQSLHICFKFSSVCGASRQAEVFTRTRHIEPRGDKTENNNSTESAELLYWPDVVGGGRGGHPEHYEPFEIISDSLEDSEKFLDSEETSTEMGMARPAITQWPSKKSVKYSISRL